MAFHESAVFTDCIDYGTRGGPRHRTRVISIPSGHEEVISKFDSPLRRWVVNVTQLREASAYSMLEFIIARRGAAYGFRFTDPFDFSTGPNGTGTPAFDDEIIGVGDGTTSIFQLSKTYTDSGVTRTRSITKPMSTSDVFSGVNGVEQTEGVDFSVDTAAGLVTYNTPPPSSQNVTWGGFFHNPVRFSLSDDSFFAIERRGSSWWKQQSIQLEEMRAGTMTPAESGVGLGSQFVNPFTVDRTITRSEAYVWVFAPNASGRTVTLQTESELPRGANFRIINDGTASFDVESFGGNAVATLAAGAKPEFILADDQNGAPVWFASA